MKNISKIAISLLLPVALCAMNFNKEFSFGLENKSLVRADYVDSKIALSLWMKDLGEKENTRINVIFYDNQKDIIADYTQNDKLDIIINDVVSYLENYPKINTASEFLWTLSTQKNSKFYRYYLIVNKKSNIKSLKDIKGKTVSVKENDSLAKLWFDKISYETNHKSYTHIIKKQINVSKISRVVLSVLFEKADFAIVTKGTWDTMTEINPSIKNSIDILLQSKSIFVPIIGAAKKNKNQEGIKSEVMKKFINTASRVKDSVRSKQIRSLIKFENAFILKPTDLDELFKFYEVYKALKKVYR